MYKFNTIMDQTGKIKKELVMEVGYGQLSKSWEQRVS